MDGEIADREPPLYAPIDSAGQAHGKDMKSYLIMMGVRLLEMRWRKDAGLQYLHCYDAASHYLRMLIDAVFGKSTFRNEIISKRVSNHNDVCGLA